VPLTDCDNILMISSPGHGAYCYAELAVSSLAMAVNTTSTHFTIPWRVGG